MSLVKKPIVSEKKIAAHRENGSLSHGPRTAEVALANSEAWRARRRQESNLREVRRLINLLLKIQRQQRPREPMEPRDEVPVGHDIQENKEGYRQSDKMFRVASL
jgi:hypothetical protein